MENNTIKANDLTTFPLLKFMENSDIAMSIKSNDSRFVYMNEASKDWCNVPQTFDYEGRYDQEFPCSWAAMASEYQTHDRKAESSRCGAEIISTSYFTRHAILEPWYCAKFPILNDESMALETLFIGRRFNFMSISNFFKNIIPSFISLTPPVDVFTERELEIIFYSIQKISAKEIAPKLGISHRTVENRLLNIYNKINVNSLNGLIDYCHNVGLNNYVPKKLLREGVNFCW